MDGDADLILGNITNDVLASNIVWTENDLRTKDARGIAGEDHIVRGVDGVVGIGMVRRIQSDVDVQLGIVSA